MSLNEESHQNESPYNTRQRLESCTHGIQQLEALRLKHKLLMEQLRHDYPSMTSLIKSLNGEETDHISQQNSPSSACSSLAPSHISDDSGCYDNSGATGLLDHPMDYSTFRKLSLEESPLRKNMRPNSSHIVEATLKNLTSQQLPTTSDYASYNSSTWSRLHKRRNQLNSNSTRPKSCYGSTNQQEFEYNRPTSMILCNSKARDSRILDSNVFAQITPPLLQRKFATSHSTIQKLEEPAQIRVKQVPRREIPILKPKLTAVRPLKLQKAELRTLIIPPSSTTSSPKFIRPNLSQKTQLPAWTQSSQPKRYQANTDYSVQCSNDIPRFTINTKVPSPAMSRVADAVRTFNSNTLSSQQPIMHEVPAYEFSKWKKNIASVAPMPKHNNTNNTVYPTIFNGSTTFPSTRKPNQMPLVGLPQHNKHQTMVQPQIFTSSCSIALGATFKKPVEKSFIQNRHSREWHASEKL